MEKYTDYEMCKECGGQCCKENGCVYLPSDFKKLDFKSLKNEIDKGHISISGQVYNGFYGNAWSYLFFCELEIVMQKLWICLLQEVLAYY